MVGAHRTLPFLQRPPPYSRASFYPLLKDWGLVYVGTAGDATLGRKALPSDMRSLFASPPPIGANLTLARSHTKQKVKPSSGCESDPSY